MKRLQAKKALVTGGSRGIGAAIVRRLAAEGADVAFTYASNAERAEATRKAAAAEGVKVLAIQADSGDSAAVADAVGKVTKELGQIDILVNNAGVLVLAPFTDLPLEEFDRTIAVNLRAVFVTSQLVARQMHEGGRIIHVGSCNAERMPFVGGSVYAMSKAGLVGLTKGMARDLGPRGITVNNIQPGPIDTDMNPADGEFASALLQLMALPRYGSGDEIGGLVAYLASTEAAYITGASLTIDGGFTA